MRLPLLILVGLAVSTSAFGQDNPQRYRPGPAELRALICALDDTTEYGWRNILSRLPGVTLGRDDVRRESDLTSYNVTFRSPFLMGQSGWFGGPTRSKASGRVRLESEEGPLFESPDGPRELLVSLGGTPVPLDNEVMRTASFVDRVAPNDGLMIGSYGRRVSPFSGNTRMEVDNLVAVNISRNILEVKIALSPRYRLCR